MKTGWDVKPLGEVCKIKPPKKLSKTTLSDEDLVSFAGMSELGELKLEFKEAEARPLSKVYSGYTYFADGDVLVAKITPCFENGKMGIAKNLTNGVGFGSSEFVPLRTGEKLIPEFLFYYLLRDDFRRDGVRVMSGAVGHKRVPNDYFEELKIPLPPLDEQKRIVAVLDAAFDGLTRARANVEANLQNARELFERSVAEIFYDEHALTIELKEAVSFHNGDRGKNYPNKSEYVEAGVPWLNTGQILPNGSLSSEKMNYISEEKFNSLGGARIQEGDLVFCLRGATIGKTAFVSPYKFGSIASSLMIIRPGDKIIDGYLYYFLTSDLGKLEIEKFIGGAAQPNLAGASVGQFLIPMPTVEKQEKITERLALIQAHCEILEKSYQSKLADLDELRQSLLQKAFAGELT